MKLNGDEKTIFSISLLTIIITLEDASFQAQMMGLSAGNSYICAVGKIHSTFTPYSDDDMIYELLQYELSAGHTEAVLFFYDNLIFFCLHLILNL